MKSLNYFVGMVNECLQEDKPRMRLYAEIDKHRLGQWKPSPSLQALPWIRGRNFSSTAPADAIDAGTRTFAALMPKISIDPMSDEIEEYEDVERKETALEWHFKRMNMGMHGRKTTHWQIMESAMRYCAVAFETEYLPFSLKGHKRGDKRIQAQLRNSAFHWTVHHPGTAHPRYSKNLMEVASIVKVVSFQEMIDEFGTKNPGIAKIKAEMFKGRAPAYDKAISTYFTYCKSYDWDETIIWLAPNAGAKSAMTTLSAKDGYILLHEEHGLDFIPFVYTDNEDPILKNAINTGLLDNLNNLRLISFSAAVTLAAQSQQLIQTQDGTLRNVKIDNQNPNQPMVTDHSVKVTPLPQVQPSPAVEEKIASTTSEVYTSTVAQILADANKLAGTENFSTANLAFQIALGNLALAKDAAERAEEEGFFQMFQWIDHAGDKPLIAFRDKAKEYQGKDLPRGEEIVIRKGEFDTRYLYIDVKLREISNLDEQAKINLAITEVERLGFSRQMVAEENGIENYHLHEQKRAIEDLFIAKMQAEITKVQAEAEAHRTRVVGMAEMEVQQAMKAAEGPQQGPGGEMPPGGEVPPPGPDQQVQDMNASFPVMEGVDMRAGGIPAAPTNPMETRETITGTDANGVGLA